MLAGICRLNDGLDRATCCCLTAICCVCCIAYLAQHSYNLQLSDMVSIASSMYLVMKVSPRSACTESVSLPSKVSCAIWAVQLVIRVSRLPDDRALCANTQYPVLWCTQSLKFVDNKHCLSWTRLIAIRTRQNVTLDASRKRELYCLPHTCSSMQHGCLSTSNRLQDLFSTRHGYRKQLSTLTVKQTEAAICMQRKKVQEEACRRKA